jgi:hypothetical protein
LTMPIVASKPIQENTLIAAIEAAGISRGQD